MYAAMMFETIPMAPGILHSFSMSCYKEEHEMTHMLYKIVWNGSSPNPSKIKGPKAEIPPLTSETQKTMIAQPQDLMSVKHSVTWAHLKV